MRLTALVGIFWGCPAGVCRVCVKLYKPKERWGSKIFLWWGMLGRPPVIYVGVTSAMY